MPIADIPPQTQNPAFCLRIEGGSRSPSGRSQTPSVFVTSKSGQSRLKGRSQAELQAIWDRLSQIAKRAHGQNTDLAPHTLMATMGFLVDFQNRVAPIASNAPHLTWSAEGEVVLEWRAGEKQLIFYINDQQITFLKAWGDDIHNEMEEGGISSRQQVSALWQWLKN